MSTQGCQFINPEACIVEENAELTPCKTKPSLIPALKIFTIFWHPWTRQSCRFSGKCHIKIDSLGLKILALSVLFVTLWI